jgi:hypothetical protein
LFTIPALAIAVLALQIPATAHPVPYRSQGTAQFAGTDFVGAGRATHLGRYTEVGTVAFAPTTDPDVLAVSGSIVYTAANGDELHATFAGELNQATGAIAATLTYVGGTGRFEDAAGSSGLTGQMLGGGAASVVVAGSIDY